MSLDEGQVARVRACARFMQDTAELWDANERGNSVAWQLRQLAVRMCQQYPQPATGTYRDAFSRHYQEAQLFPAGVLAGGTHVVADVSRIADGVDSAQLEALANQAAQLKLQIEEMRNARSRQATEEGTDDLYASTAGVQ